MSSRIEEYRATYKRMPDDQLLELADEVDDLTEEARTALWAELERRGIAEAGGKTPDKKTSRSSPAMPADTADWDLLGERPPALPPSEFVAVFSAEKEAEAEQVQESLRSAGVESLLEFVVLVRQSESEKAFEILSEQLGPDADADEDEVEEDKKA